VYRIEREEGDYSIPTVPMLRRIATAAGRTDAERQSLVFTLLLQREYMICPEELRHRLRDEPPVVVEGVSSETMPHPFLDRLSRDLEDVSASQCGTVARALGLPVDKKVKGRACLAPLLDGHVYLTRSQIIKVAKQLRQDVDDYLLLAYHLPVRMATLVEGDPTSNFLQVLQRLDPVASQTLLDLIALQVEGFRVRQSPPSS